MTELGYSQASDEECLAMNYCGAMTGAIYRIDIPVRALAFIFRPFHQNGFEHIQVLFQKGNSPFPIKWVVKRSSRIKYLNSRNSFIDSCGRFETWYSWLQTFMVSRLGKLKYSN